MGGDLDLLALVLMEMVDKIRSEACDNSSEAAVIEFQHSEKIGGNSSSSSSSYSNEAASETVIDVRSAEETVIDVRSAEEVQEHEKRSKVEDGGLASNQVVAGETKLLGDQEACVVNVDADKGCDKLEEEKVCRICHLEPDQRLDLSELFQLGCDCRGELGVAHRHCAEAWFKVKGDRFCEICGEMAVNVPGAIEHRIMVEWNERRMEIDGITGVNSSSERSCCCRGQPFCNFLMACLVIAFILPWFFRVNMF